MAKNKAAHPSTDYAFSTGTNVLPLEWDILRGLTTPDYHPYDFFDDGVTEGSGIWQHWAEEISSWLGCSKTTARRALNNMVSKGMLDSSTQDDGWFDSKGKGHPGTWFSLTADGAALALRIGELDPRTASDMAATPAPEPEPAKGPSTPTGRTNTSHAGHDHPATAKARAACRKAAQA